LLIHLDYRFVEEVAIPFANGDENAQQPDDETVLAALDGTADEKLTSIPHALYLFCLKTGCGGAPCCFGSTVR
jgi:ParB family chromosome partitioning protein